jgi:periplasmic protein CpxP/Spy
MAALRARHDEWTLPQETNMRLLPIVLIFFGGLSTNVTLAQSPAENPPAASPADPGKRSPSEVVDMLARKLSLTDDQKTKILPIIAARQQKMQEARSDSSSRPGQRMRQVKSIMDDSDAKINALLTPDQQQTYLQIEQQMRDNSRARRTQGSSAQ